MFYPYAPQLQNVGSCVIQSVTIIINVIGPGEATTTATYHLHKSNGGANEVNSHCCWETSSLAFAQQNFSPPN